MVPATPLFPTSLSAVHALREDRCIVSVVFDLLEDGTPELVSAKATDERCKVFEKSAIQSILDSEFKTGESAEQCRILHTFVFDDE